MSSIVTYTCDPGYNITSGDEIQICLESGNWSSSQPLCEGNVKIMFQVNPLSPRDALKHHFISAKTDLMFIQPYNVHTTVLEQNFP